MTKIQRRRFYENRMSAFVRKDHKGCKVVFFGFFFLILSASFSLSVSFSDSLPLLHTLLPPPSLSEHAERGGQGGDGGG